MKSIFTALAPNVEKDDALLALRLLFLPWRWKRGKYRTRFADTLKKWLPASNVILFESGRSGLYALLRCLDIKKDDEVLLQAFTCVAVPNSVLWAGATPVYVDCEDKTFNMSVPDLEAKITARSKAIIVQHTFGNPADLNSIMTLARKHNLFVIEDCAHALGVVFNGKNLGTFGDASFFSFGRDKVISSTFGGAVATNDAVIARRLEAFYFGLVYPSAGWIFQQLWYPVVMYVVRRTYDMRFGKIFLAALRAFHWISKPVYPEEKTGRRPPFVSRRMPEALTRLALHQFAKLERLNAHRRRLASLYARVFRGSGLLRFTIKVPHSGRLRQQAQFHKIYFGDWYSTAIAPSGVSYDAIKYMPSSCPIAERLSQEAINLPTDIHITNENADRIIQCIKREMG